MIDKLKFDPFFDMLATAPLMCICNSTFVLLLGRFHGDELRIGVVGFVLMAVPDWVHSLLWHQLCFLVLDLERHRVRQVVEELDLVLSFGRQLLHLLLVVLLISVLALATSSFL